MFLSNAGIAQLVEHLIRNERVTGSNPAIGSNENKGSSNQTAGTLVC